MRIYYNCEYCGAHIDTLEVDRVDEVKFGFHCLTEEERQDIIRVDYLNNSMYVQSLCDGCIETLGLAQNAFNLQGKGLLH